MPDFPPCSHCGDKFGVTEGLMEFHCIECGWWGPSPDKIIYEPPEDSDFRQGQVPKRSPDGA